MLLQGVEAVTVAGEDEGGNVVSVRQANLVSIAVVNQSCFTKQTVFWTDVFIRLPSRG